MNDYSEDKGDLIVLRQEPLRLHTTFQIGGPAAWFVKPASLQQLRMVISLLKKKEFPFFVVGNGSDLLAPDEGYAGVIISLSCLSQITDCGKERIYAQAGVPLSKVSSEAMKRSLTGAEFASGIPGSVGGAIYMNAGAYGHEIGEILERVDYVDENLREKSLSTEECDFAYRESIFQKNKNWIVTGALFHFRWGDRKQIETLTQEFNSARQEKQPLNFPSAGSVFKRPEGYYAAVLIEQCGLKGLRVGDAMVSEKHAGFIVNLGHARASDVRALMSKVQQIVFEKTGVFLEPEIESMI